MASPSPCLQIINPEYGETEAFPQFPQLPPEIRFKIWEQSLHHERLIRLRYRNKNYTRLRDRNKHAMIGTSRDTETWHSMPGIESIITVKNRNSISKLFRTCSESRQVALRFYRVQVPCFYRKRGSPLVEGIFYFHPELDIIEIESGLLSFGPLAYTLWKCDPRGVGLINVSWSNNHCYYGPLDMYRLCQHPMDPLLVRASLSRLRRVFFSYDGVFGRGVLDCHYFENCQLIRSRPLEANVPKFERLPQDPRLVQNELKRVFLGNVRPRAQIQGWFRFIAKLGVEYDEPVEYRFRINTTCSRGVKTREKALLSLQCEKNEWERVQELLDKRGRTWREADNSLPSAYGFWLFPISAFGPFLDPDEEFHNPIVRGLTRTSSHRLPRVWDLSEHTPELCLQYLPKSPSAHAKFEEIKSF